jgi:hypothetical protein
VLTIGRASQSRFGILNKRAFGLELTHGDYPPRLPTLSDRKSRLPNRVAAASSGEAGLVGLRGALRRLRDADLF